VFDIFRDFRAYRLGHDFGGAGSVRESILTMANFPEELLLPFIYGGIQNGSICKYNAANAMTGARRHYTLQKSRSLALLCAVIQARYMPIPLWDEEKSLPFEDFTHLLEDRIESRRGPTVTHIIREPGKPDDVANAVNYAAAAHWHSLNAFPDLASKFGIVLTASDVQDIMPGEAEWAEQ
jgi:hypothetical protein